ncbi:MAG: TRAP transporter fused permease subunit [Clostridia bacterium]|nr:TRAP transporter fused permease subunit [Clostridia bacterium]
MALKLFKKKEKAPVTEATDLESVMKKYDQESNVRIWEGKPKIAVTCVLAAFSLFCIYVTLFTTWLEEIRLTSFVALIVFMGFIVFPAKKGIQRVNYMPWYDIVAMIVGPAAFLYFTANALTIIQQGAKFQMYQILIGIVGILALAEVCRRAVGLPILIVAACFIVYALTVGLANPTFSGRLNYVIRTLFYSKEGILSTPVNTCSKYIVVFIIFGAFLERTGIADFFIQAANAVVGGFSGGPAKVAVVASALEGMVSGSSVANTVGSGSITIPLMKKTGYKPEFAGAAEAAASTGGQIMPPIMGAAAFLMSDNIGIPYSEIIKSAILPALLYFAGIFIAVHLEAKKLGLRGIDKSELPKWRLLVRQVYLLIPLAVLIVLVTTNSKTIQTAAAIAILAAIGVSLLSFVLRTIKSGKWNRDTLRDFGRTMLSFFEALAAGGQGTIAVAAACGIAGVIGGTITMTGLANLMINGIVTIANGRVIIALFFTMICCIILGMGVPTTANYCIMAATCAPILVRMGVPLIAAHFFVFYFGIVADLTPPVALAAYAGAAIAQANPMKTALQATKLAIAAFIVPYVFALNPIMLFEGETTIFQILLITLTSLLGIFGVSAGLEGWILTKMNPVQRLISASAGILLIDPSPVTDVIGVVVIALIIVWQILQKKRSDSAPTLKAA